MQRAGSSNASSKVRSDPERPASHFCNVISAPPAKRITFFKSGDAQFCGVRMAIHKRSFKCFDALLDDLSQKVPLPFGVRTITTPRGTHSIQHLEQLEDGGCYLCSDRRYVKPIDVEAAGKRPAVWHHSHPHNSRKKPSRPEEPPTGHPGQHYHRHPKRILLVKNNDPAVRRSIILSRKMARSLRVFMDEISELMQCHVRKLYTLEGRKIDSIQSLMQCPSILVCVGREPFKPLLLENLRKHSDEKLPGMGTRSRSSICSESHESKKNVNFGLETKKSIIHPRSDSSNRSTRFSLSSEKSYPNGLCMTPGQSGCVSTCPYTKEVILNDDIEKRVLVNKDGSLSVEMKVRFRLINDETLQWSTEIKKSATTSNESGSVKEGAPHYLQGKTEYSDPESNSACEADEACASKSHQKHLEESHCQNCCNHCQEYDIWKNPMHKDNGDSGGRKSCSSSASSHKIMHKKTSVDSVRTISRSSEEYTERVIEKASCFQQTVEEGDTRVEYCSISHCCSHSEVSGTATKLKRPNEDISETNIINICHRNGDRKLNAAFENTFGDPGGFKVLNVTEERPISAVSNSSKVLESLKEDQDDEYDDLPPSASRASEWSQSDNPEQENHFTCVHCNGSKASQNSHLSPRPPSKVSSCSAHSSKHKKHRSTHPATDSARSSKVSKVSSRPPCSHSRAVTPGSVASDTQDGLEEKNLIAPSEDSIVSNKSKPRINSPRAVVLNAHDPQVACEERTTSEDRPRSVISANTDISGTSRNSSVCPFCGGCERSIIAVSRLSGNTQDTQPQEADKDAEVKSVGGRSSKSHRSKASVKSTNKRTEGASPVPHILENDSGEHIQGRSESALSGLSNSSATQRQSKNVENAELEDVKERTKSAMSVKSNASQQSMTNSITTDEALKTSRLDKAGEINQDEKAVSPMSHKSNRLSASRSSHKSHCSPQDQKSERGHSLVSNTSTSHGQEPEVIKEQRVNSAMSATSNSSSKHPCSVLETPERSAKSQTETMDKNVSPVPTASENNFDQDQELEMQERSASAKSMKSKTSSRKVKENAKLNELENVTSQVSNVESEERVHSSVSAKTYSSTRSHRSDKLDKNLADTATTLQLNGTSSVTKNFQEVVDSKRPTSTISKSSKVSVKSNDCSERASESMLMPTAQTEHTKSSTQNSLTVRSPTPKKSTRIQTASIPKSPVTTEMNDRAPSGSSVNSKASSKSTRSKCHCSSNNMKDENSKIPLVNDVYVERAASSLSEKSIKSHSLSPYGQSDEPLSPTSTASVSLGMDEEEKSDDLNEGSISNTSPNLEEHKSLSERSTPEPAGSDHPVDSSEILKIKERAQTAASMSSAVSKNSKRSPIPQDLCKSSERALSPASVAKSESVRSIKSKAQSMAGSQLNDDSNRVSSSLSVSSGNRCNNSACKASKPSDNSAIKRIKESPQAVTENNKIDEGQADKALTISSKCSLNKTKASGRVKTIGTAQFKDQEPAKNKNMSSSNLKIKENKTASDCNSDASSVKSLKTSNSDTKTHEKREQRSKQTSPAIPDVLENRVDHAYEMPNKNVMPVIHLDSSNDSVLSHTLSAADLLREKVGNPRPVSRGSESSTSGKNCHEEIMNIGSKCGKQKNISTSSLNKTEYQGLGLMPSSLPNASPTEIINDWLKNIPADGPMYEMEDEFNEQHDEAIPQIITINDVEEQSLQKEIEELSENVIKIKESQKIECPAGGNPVKDDNSAICDETKPCNEISETNELNTSPTLPSELIKREGMSKRCHSSVQVMKILLSPKLDRCNSLPEVSPVYGRKLSTSAKGLLDCLVNLQVIDTDPKNEKNEKYNEIISILQSLWIYEPSENEQYKQKIKDHCSAEDEFNPRSSSGVDVSSGSTRSGKGSIEKSETTQGRVGQVSEQEALQIQEETVKEDEDDPSSTTTESTKSHVLSNPLTPDIAERVRCSPENEKLDEKQQKDDSINSKEEIAESNANQNEINEAEFSNESSGKNHNAIKSPDKDTNLPEKSTSGTPFSNQRGILSRKVSQDPDPIWVLNLLKKLEKQFMSHYANAMAEFKVKWDLDDNEMLDKMISELKEEVQKRIQSSINRELQKIHSRAGRTPRPPISALPRDSTVQTEQRRRRLKVMRNKSINPSLSRSEDMYTASGTENSDQRSDDEYCPCDACMSKKMASKGVQRAEALSLAPVMKDFDLRKILQIKNNSPATMATGCKMGESKKHKQATNCSNVPEQNNMNVVHEESEVHNDMKSQVDEDKVKAEGTAEATLSKDEKSVDNGQASKSQDASLINDEGGEVEEELSGDGNEAGQNNLEVQAAENEVEEKKAEIAEKGESEIEGVEESNAEEENIPNDKGEESENKKESVAVDDIEETVNEEDAVEDKTAEPGEAGNCEHGNDGETTKEEEADAAMADEAGVTEDEKEEETHLSGDESKQLEDVEDDANINEIDEATDKIDEDDTTNKSETKTPNKNDGNQDESAKAEHEAKNRVDENEDQETEQEGQQLRSLTASDVEQAEVEDCKEHQSGTGAESTGEADNQNPDHNNEKDNSVKNLTEQLNTDDTEADDACHGLVKQITKTSVESQPGSLEYATDQKVQAKLKDICSFMDSLESQDDSIVVITKQSPFTERRHMSSRHGNKEEVQNEVIEWQVSPKRRNRSPARVNKQKRPKDSDTKVDDLEF